MAHGVKRRTVGRPKLPDAERRVRVQGWVKQATFARAFDLIHAQERSVASLIDQLMAEWVARQEEEIAGGRNET